MKIIKTIITFILIFIHLSFLYSQTTFSKVIDGVNGNEYGIELEYYRGDYFTVSKGVIIDTVLNKSNTHDFLLVNDSLLNRINKFKIRHYFKSHQLLIENDTLYLQGTDHSEHILKSKWNMYKFSIDGDSLDLLEYNDFDSRVGWYKTFIKNNYIYSGGKDEKNSLGGAEILILKMDKRGNFIRENRFFEFANPEYLNVFGDLTLTVDGNLALSNAYFGVPFDIFTHIGVCKFDENLDTIWTKYFHKSRDGLFFNEKHPKITSTLDSGLIIGTAMNINDSIDGFYSKEYYEDMVEAPLLFYKLDKDGNIEWTDTIFDYREPGKGAGPMKVILNMITASNGDIIGVGEYSNLYDDPEKQAWVFRYSPDGKLKWQHTYIDREYTTESSLFFDVREAENGDIICFGGLKTDSIGEWYNTQYSWLLRVDSNGCYTPGCALADTLTKVLTDIEDLTKDGLARRIEIYPNPANDYINVSLPEGMMWKQWSIYNFNGQKVMNGHIDMKLQTLIIEGIEELQSGIHFVLLKDNKGKRGIGKFVVE